MVRVSFGCYNTLEEVYYLIEMPECILAGDYQGDYVVDPASGMYFPRGFDLYLLAHFSPLWVGIPSHGVG